MPMPPLVEVINIRWCPQRQCIYVRFQIRVDTLSDQLYFDAVSVYKVGCVACVRTYGYLCVPPCVCV